MPAEETTYLYCQVRFRRASRDYSYLTRDAGLRAGDFVSAPFGKNDHIRVGEVRKVERCTAETAPFPPERTKWILEKVPKPEDWDKPREPAPAPQKPKPNSRPKPPPPQRKVPEKPCPEPAVKPETIPPPKPTPTPPPRPVPPPKQGRAKPRRDRDRWQTWALVLASVAFLCGVTVLTSRFLLWQRETYRGALRAMNAGDYSAAEDAFLELSKYRDAPSFAIYCKYAGMEPDRAAKAHGDWALERLTLQRETAYQTQINALAAQISRHREEMEAAAEAERQAALEEQCKQDYPGKEPAVGMYMDYLQYTAFGRPREYVKSEYFDSPRVSSYNRTITVRWYTPGGLLRAYGVCRANKDGDFVLDSVRIVASSTPSHSGLTYGGGTSSSGTTSGSTGGKKHGSSGLRDEYDSPEDLWEDNRDYYESEDEAWDDWYDD